MFLFQPARKRSAAGGHRNVIAKRGLGVEVGRNASRQARRLPVAAQALDGSLAASLSVLVQLQVIEGAAHALLDVKNLAQRSFGSDPVERVGRLPVGLADLELDLPAHVPGLTEHQLQLFTHLLIALAIWQDDQGMEMQIGEPALALPPTLGRYGLEVDQPLPVNTLVVKAAVEKCFDIAGFVGQSRQSLINAAVDKHRTLAIEGNHGGRDVRLLQHIRLFLPDDGLQIVEVACRRDNVAVNFPLIWSYRSLR